MCPRPRRSRWGVEVEGRLRRIGADLAVPLLLVLGLVLVAAGNPSGGLALVMAAAFARIALRGSRRRSHLEQLIEGMTVGEVMETASLVVAPQATLSTFATSLDATGETTVARVMRDDELLGLVGPQEVGRVPPAKWDTVHAVEAMAAATDLPALAPDDPLRPAADRLGASHASGFPVLADERLAGVLTRFAIGRVLHDRSMAATPRRGPEPPAAPADGGR